jgi:flagellar hook-length control protein FliK
MTIAALTSPALGKAATLTHAAAQPGAPSLSPDEQAFGADFGALLRGHVTAAAAPEVASDLPAVAAETVGSKRDPVDPVAEPGASAVGPEVATLLASPLVPLVAVVVAPADRAVQRSESVELAADRRGAAAWRGGELAAGIAADGKSLPLLPVAIAEPDDVLKGDAKLTHVADADMSTQVRPNALISTPVPKPVDVPATLAVEPKVGSPAWDGALGQRVVWMATQHQQVAEMRLNPPNLGPLEVRLTISGDQASAQFVSHHPAVREALESALPRLREMLAESGLTLGNVQVGSESFTQGRASDQGANGSARQGIFPASEVSEPSPARAGLLALPSRGMVDTFA